MPIQALAGAATHHLPERLARQLAEAGGASRKGVCGNALASFHRPPEHAMLHGVEQLCVEIASA